MIQKPSQFAPGNAEAFQDRGVVDAYRYRPPYPDAVFDVLLGLIGTRPRHILDVGCGTGNLARQLVTSVERVDAVDFSRQMIEHGRELPNGDHSHLHWIDGRVEGAALDPPYALITAGESLHWMDLSIVLPRFRQLLTPGGYLAIVVHDTVPDAWSILGEIIPRYRVDGGFEPFDLIGQLEAHGLFEKVGVKKIGPVPFRQSIDDYIESYHSRSGFSRERMGAASAAAFDEELREFVLRTWGDTTLALQVTASVEWGLPGG
jgi:SAM-dependent methyltransferase